MKVSHQVMINITVESDDSLSDNSLQNEVSLLLNEGVSKTLGKDSAIITVDSVCVLFPCF
jgi:hypothetical protein